MGGAESAEPGREIDSLTMLVLEDGAKEPRRKNLERLEKVEKESTPSTPDFDPKDDGRKPSLSKMDIPDNNPCCKEPKAPNVAAPQPSQQQQQRFGSTDARERWKRLALLHESKTGCATPPTPGTRGRPTQGFQVKSRDQEDGCG